MEHNRKQKLLMILALVLGITSLSIGFAAFSTTLNISSSASVSPNSDTFSVLFSSSGTLQATDKIIPYKDSNLASAEAATISGTTISGLKANFTRPGQSVSYTFYAHNASSYIAYLRNVTFGMGKTCTPGTGTTASLVEAACDDIKIYVEVNGIPYTEDTVVGGHSLAIDGYETVTVYMRYRSFGAKADGDFTVSFDDISLIYSTVDNENLITFTVEGTSYQAIEGMSWIDFINSEYNVNQLFSEDSTSVLFNNRQFVAFNDCSRLLIASETISANYDYKINCNVSGGS